MNPNPQLITDSLVRRLNDCYNQLNVPDLKLIRLEEDALKLREQDRAAGEMVLGLIAGLRADKDQVHRHYDAAKYFGDQFFIHRNFSVALAGARDYQASLKALQDAIRTVDVTNPTELSFLCTSAVLFGLTEVIMEMRDKLKLLQGSNFDESFLPSIEKLQQLNIRDLHEQVMLVLGILGSHGVQVYEIAVNVSPLYHEEYAEYVIQISEQDSERLAQYQIEIYDAVAQYEINHDLPSQPIGFRLVQREPS